MVIETETCCARNLGTLLGRGPILRSLSIFARSKSFRACRRFPSCDRLRGNRIVFFGAPIRVFPPFKNACWRPFNDEVFRGSRRSTSNAPEGLSHETNAKYNWKLRRTQSRGFVESTRRRPNPFGGLHGDFGWSGSRLPRKPAIRKSARWMEPSHPGTPSVARDTQRTDQLLGNHRSALCRNIRCGATHR